MNGDGIFWRRGGPFSAFLEWIESTATGTVDRFVPRNFVIDERIADEHADSYSGTGAAAGHADLDRWHAAHVDYLRQRVWLPPRRGRIKTVARNDADRCPDAFR